MDKSENVTNIYVSLTGDLTAPNSFNVSTLRAMEEINSMYDRPSKVWIDNGHYNGDGFPIILFNPTQIEGLGRNNTSISGAILGVDYLGVKDLTTYGETVDFF